MCKGYAVTHTVIIINMATIAAALLPQWGVHGLQCVFLQYRGQHRDAYWRPYYTVGTAASMGLACWILYPARLGRTHPACAGDGGVEVRVLTGPQGLLHVFRSGIESYIAML